MVFVSYNSDAFQAKFWLIYPYIRRPFTPSFTPSLGYARNEGVTGADCPVLLGLFEGRRTKSQVLLHSGLPHQLPRQSQLTTLTAIWPLQSLAFLENPDPRQYPRLGMFSPLRHSRYIGHNVARVFGGFTSSGACQNSSPTKNSSRPHGREQNFVRLKQLLFPNRTR